LLLIGPFTGTLSERVPARLLVAGGLIVMAFGLLLLSGIDDNSSYLDLLPGLLVGGLGGALTIPLNAAAIGAVPVEKSGVASGIFNTARETGGSLGIAIIVPFSPAPGERPRRRRRPRPRVRRRLHRRHHGRGGARAGRRSRRADDTPPVPTLGRRRRVARGIRCMIPRAEAA
jgi:hypothetical protein